MFLFPGVNMLGKNDRSGGGGGAGVVVTEWICLDFFRFLNILNIDGGGDGARAEVGVGVGVGAVVTGAVS